MEGMLYWIYRVYYLRYLMGAVTNLLVITIYISCVRKERFPYYENKHFTIILYENTSIDNKNADNIH